jgi:hypothetical protein
VALLALSSIAVADSSVPKEGGGSAPMLSLERTACYGRCPIYTVTVLRDGTVQWEGRRFVKTVGKATGKLAPGALAAIADEMKRADFFAFHDKYTSYDVTDHPSAIITYADAAKKKTVQHYHGDRSAPEKLSQLEERLDELIGTGKWIGRDQR